MNKTSSDAGRINQEKEEEDHNNNNNNNRFVKNYLIFSDLVLTILIFI